MEYFYLSHWGIKGQKWGIRRFRNYDDTLTAAGKKRYGDGGIKAIKKAEKEKRRREKIMSDPKKLYKHRHEFTAAELEAARNRFDIQAQIREQAQQQRVESLKNKLEEKRIREEGKAKIKEAQARSIAADQKTEFAKAEEKRKADKAKADEKRAKAEEQRKVDEAEEKKKNSKWENRAKKWKGIWDTSTNLKSVFDELGVTDPKSGKSLFGSLGSALGWSKKDAKEASESKDDKSDSSSKKKKKGSEAVTDAVKDVLEETKVAEVMKKTVDVLAEENLPFKVRDNAILDAEDELRKGRVPKFEDMIDSRYKQSKAYEQNQKEYEELLKQPLESVTGIDLSSWMTDEKKKKKK